MKIFFYLFLMAVVAAVIYALYVRISDIDTESITSGISSAINSATDWLSGKISEIIS